jgi:hypothetical protein
MLFGLELINSYTRIIRIYKKIECSELDRIKIMERFRRRVVWGIFEIKFIELFINNLRLL